MASSIKKNGCIRWHCPVCDIALDVKKGQHAKITRHIHRMHHDYVAKNLEANRSCGYRSSKATSGIGIRDLMQPIKFTKVGSNAHFLCPFCDEGLATKPRSRHLLVMSKKAHLINDCKKVKKSLKRMPILKYTRPGWVGRSMAFIRNDQFGVNEARSLQSVPKLRLFNVDMMQLTLRWCCLIRPKSQKTKGRSSCHICKSCLSYSGLELWAKPCGKKQCRQIMPSKKFWKGMAKTNDIETFMEELAIPNEKRMLIRKIVADE